MPIEVVKLMNEPPPLEACPNCGTRPFEPFLRGQVQRSGIFGRIRAWWRGETYRYCAIICWACKEIVGWE